jgi:hypothetical protein
VNVFAKKMILLKYSRSAELEEELQMRAGGCCLILEFSKPCLTHVKDLA